MASARRLIVTADDFGQSDSINQAVVAAHQNGILTTASLMVAGPSAAEAVLLAREHPRLGVGLHLTLCAGRAALPFEQIPVLVNRNGDFSHNPFAAGVEYFFSPAARKQLRLEIEAQFARFSETGLVLDHVNGHLHFHLHPVVFDILEELAGRWQVRTLRLTREPWELNFLRESGRWAYRLSHAFVFGLLSRRARPRLMGCGVQFGDQVFGLLQNGLITEEYLLRLIPALPPGVSEIYSHPCVLQSKHELEALVSLPVKDVVRRERIELIRYQDLWPNC